MPDNESILNSLNHSHAENAMRCARLHSHTDFLYNTFNQTSHYSHGILNDNLSPSFSLSKPTAGRCLNVYFMYRLMYRDLTCYRDDVHFIELMPCNPIIAIIPVSCSSNVDYHTDHHQA